MRKRRARRSTSLPTALASIWMVLPVVLPLLLIVSGTFMSPGEAQHHYTVGMIEGRAQYAELCLLPERFSLSQYDAALAKNPEYFYYFWNTVALALPALAGTLVVSALGSFGFAKYDFPFKRPLFFLYVLVVILPYQLMLTPNFIVMDRLGLLGTRASVILPALFAPLGVFLLNAYMRAIPDETLESARIDGAGEARVFLSIALPQAAPGLAALFMLALVDLWSLVEQPMIFLRDEALQPLSVALASGSQWIGTLFVGLAFFMLPLVLAFLICQESLIEGVGRLLRGGDEDG